MTAAASLVLAVVQAHPGWPVWKLADEAGLTVEATAAALRQLQAAGLVRRGEDRGAVVVWTATDAGRVG